MVAFRESGSTAVSLGGENLGKCVREQETQYQVINESGTADLAASYAAME